MSFATTEVVRAHSKKIRCAIREETLRQNILNSTAPGVTDREYEPGRQLIVSLTTFGPRIDWCGPAIESIMEQTVKANRIVLWLGHEFEKPHMIPADLRMLERRGLEIRFTDDYGPATKLIPSLKAFPNGIIVTVDYDRLYTYDLLDKLMRGHYRQPEAVVTDWEDGISIGTDNRPTYILNLKHKPEGKPTMHTVALGVAGVLYPPHCMHPDVTDIDTLMQVSPKADDLWFKIMQLRAGTPVYCVGTTLPDGERLISMEHHSTELSLYRYNLLQNGNDHQLAKLHERYPEAFEVFCKV